MKSFKEGDIQSLLKQVHRLTDQIRQIELNEKMKTQSIQKKSPSFGQLQPAPQYENIETSFLMSNQELLEL